MTNLQITIAQTIAENPLRTDADIARLLGVSKEYLCKLKRKPEWQEYLQHCLDLQWREYGQRARKQMSQLADNGDYRAIEFLLKTNGINPATKVEADVNAQVVVNIVDDTEY